MTEGGDLPIHPILGEVTHMLLGVIEVLGKVLEEVVYSLAHLVSRNSSLLPSLPGDQTAYFLPSLPGDQLHRSLTVLKKRKARR